MKTFRGIRRFLGKDRVPVTVLGVLVGACSYAKAADAPKLIPLETKLPAAAFKGTPANVPTNSYTEPYSEAPPAALMIPADATNLAPAAKLTTSSTYNADKLNQLVDGDKEASEQSVVILKKGTQYVQMDLGSPAEIFAVVIWHAHATTKIYHDVIVQVADDADFKQNVRAIFNNDQDNSSGLGVGTDREYFEIRYGKRIDAKGIKARYLRFYSKGSTESSLNEYTELEVYGRPVK
jgi:hypothetical protein